MYTFFMDVQSKALKTLPKLAHAIRVRFCLLLAECQPRLHNEEIYLWTTV